MAAAASDAPVLAYDDVAQHNTPTDAWVIVGDSVYDVTDFAPMHPGGARYIHKYAGKVATEEFVSNHPITIIERTLPNRGADHLVGTVDLDALPEEAFVANPGFEAASQDDELVSTEEQPPLEACLNTFDYEAVAMKFMPITGRKKGWDYYSSGADDEETLRNNANAFHRVWLRPRVLRNVEDIDMSCDILGNACSFPLYLSSVAMQRLGHEDGELAWIRACNTHSIIQMLPTMSSYSADECFDECNKVGTPFFYQLYVHPDRDKCAEDIRLAEVKGCQALFITVDTPVLGRRDRDRRNKVDSNTSAAGSGAIGTGSPKDASLNWDDIPWFRSTTKMKLFLKGVGTAEDAVLAKKAGLDGIVCSNHGGRQLNTARSGLEILAEVTAALRAEFTEAELADFWVFMDGGIRRGTDIFKALALGARAVGIGKPATFAMSAYGQAGIEQMVGQLKDEFRNVMQLMGVTSVQQIRDQGPSMIDATNLATHLDINPTDAHYEPVNVFTHGKLPQLFVPDAGQGAMPSTTTTTETVTGEDGSITTRVTTTTGPDGGAADASAEAGRANHYGVASTVPGDSPIRRVDFADLEDLAQFANEDGEVKFCRCWKSSTFPLCDNSHVEHNETCGDNAAPMVITGFDPVLKSLANNYSVPSTVPPDAPTKRVDMLNVEDIAAQVASDGDVKFCRCWKSANFPFCDDSHDGHNEACAAKERGSADNAAPVVLTSGLPAEKRGLDKVETLPAGSEPELDHSLAGQGHANNYAVPSNMPPGEPTKRVEIIDIEDITGEVASVGEVKFCRCWKSASFPFCDGSHDGHNMETGDNTGPVVLTPGSKM